MAFGGSEMCWWRKRRVEFYSVDGFDDDDDGGEGGEHGCGDD